MFLRFAQKAFSLIELMIVISIIGVISAVSLGSLTTIQKNNRDAQRQADLRLIQGALQQFYADRNYYPNAVVLTAGAAINSCTSVSDCTIVSRIYLNKTPIDPSSGTTTPYCYKGVVSAVAGAADCSSLTPSTCQFYRLYANLENPGGTPASYTCGAAPANSYDFEVTTL